MVINKILGFICDNNDKSNDQVIKCWLSLIYDIVSRDNGEEKMKNYLTNLVPDVLKNLLFTK